MLWLLIFVGIVASAIAGVLTDWLLKAWLPEKPRTKHVVASTVAIVVLLTIAAIASSIGSLPKPTDTNPTSVTPQVLMVSDITPTVARGENRAGGGGGRIAFVSSINNNDEIFVANVDGSALTSPITQPWILHLLGHPMERKSLLHQTGAEVNIV